MVVSIGLPLGVLGRREPAVTLRQAARRVVEIGIAARRRHLTRRHAAVGTDAHTDRHATLAPARLAAAGYESCGNQSPGLPLRLGRRRDARRSRRRGRRGGAGGCGGANVGGCGGCGGNVTGAGTGELNTGGAVGGGGRFGWSGGGGGGLSGGGGGGGGPRRTYSVFPQPSWRCSTPGRSRTRSRTPQRSANRRRSLRCGCR